MSTTQEELKYRLDELTTRAGITSKGIKRLRIEIRKQTGKARETVARWYSKPIDEPGCISLEDGVIISKILKCRPEDLLTPKQTELFSRQKQVA